MINRNRCRRCGKELSAKESVVRGIGPVCWARIRAQEAALERTMESLFKDGSMEIKTGYEEWAADPRRAKSPEVDFGVHWYEERAVRGGVFWPTWRISWIQNTGELYAVEQASSSPERPRRFVVLGVFPTREEVERFMEGWAERPRRIGPVVNTRWVHRQTG